MVWNGAYAGTAAGTAGAVATGRPLTEAAARAGAAAIIGEASGAGA